MPDPQLEQVSRTLFVLWHFPVLTEVFIHRELSHFQQLGAEVQVLAATRVARDDLDGELAVITERALFLGSTLEWLGRGMAWAARHPRDFAPVLSWVLRLPHRSARHRARMLATLVAAAAAVERIDLGRFRFLHAHFAAQQAELAMCLSRLTGLPYGLTLHAYDIWQDGNLLVEKIAGARVALTCTRRNLEHLRGLAPEHAHKLHLVHHGLDLRQPPAPPAVGGRWLAVGRLVPKKGFADLLDAVAWLRDRGRLVQLTILGDGPLRAQLERRITALGLRAQVRLAGEVANAEVWAALAQATGLVAPSVRDADGNQDGIPNVILEAMATGRPVVATSISGLPEAVRDGETGLLVPPHDAPALARALIALEDDSEMAARLGRNARAYVEAHFDLRHNARAQLALLAGRGRSA